MLIQREVFPAFESLCVYAFHECYVCVLIYVVDVCEVPSAGTDRVFYLLSSLISGLGSLRLHARGCMTQYCGLCKPVQGMHL
jgi:hypothetical protein